MFLSKQNTTSEKSAQNHSAQVNDAGNARSLPAVPVLQQKTAEEDLQLSTEPVQKKENKTGMPDNLKSGIENLSGMDMGDVKVHYNSSQPAQLNAHAYAQGSQIHIGPGQEQHLAHEAWHVVQQRQGRVKPTMQMKQGVAVNDDPGLENEADVMGAKALQMKSDALSDSTGNPDTFQMQKVVQRTVSVGAANYASATLAFNAISPGLAALNQLHLRSVISQYNHDNRVFVDEPMMQAAATNDVQALAAATVVGLWADERLEAKTTVGGREYTFNMSFKHLRDTYRRTDRAHGAANTANAQGNTILNLDDAGIMARFCALVEDVRANVLVGAAVHPHQLPQGTNRAVGGVTYVTEGTLDVHIYPIAGGLTINLTNDQYEGLVAFARWQRNVGDNTQLGMAVARLADITAAAVHINAITGVGNCVTLVQDAARAQAAVSIGNEVARINAGMNGLLMRVQALRAQLDARDAAGWVKPLQRTVGNLAVTTVEAANLHQRGVVAGIVGMATLSARVADSTITHQQALDALAPGTAALAALIPAVGTAETNYAAAVQEDTAVEEPEEEGGMMNGLGF